MTFLTFRLAAFLWDAVCCVQLTGANENIRRCSSVFWQRCDRPNLAKFLHLFVGIRIQLLRHVLHPEQRPAVFRPGLLHPVHRQPRVRDGPVAKRLHLLVQAAQRVPQSESVWGEVTGQLKWNNQLTRTWNYFALNVNEDPWGRFTHTQGRWVLFPTSVGRRSRVLCPWPAWSFQPWFCPGSPGSAGNDPVRSPPGRGLHSEVRWMHATTPEWSIAVLIFGEYELACTPHLLHCLFCPPNTYSRSSSGTARWPSAAPCMFSGWSGTPATKGEMPNRGGSRGQLNNVLQLN